jgi:hypothetical protein
MQSAAQEANVHGFFNAVFQEKIEGFSQFAEAGMPQRRS